MCETITINSCKTVKKHRHSSWVTWLFYHLSTAGAGPLKSTSVPFMFNLSSSCSRGCRAPGCQGVPARTAPL